MIVAYVPDLLDRSRLVPAAGGQEVQFVASPGELAAAAAAGARLVLVDLGRPGVLDALEALAPGPVVLGFGAHVDRDLLDEARRRGCQVHPRSELFRRAAELLAPP